MKTFRKYLKESRKLTEDQLPSDSWFREYMQDVREGEGWVDLDKVILDIYDTLDLDLYDKEGEVARTIRRLGYGKYLRESCKTLKEARQESYNRLEFETIGGKPEIQFIGDEIHMSCWSSGAKVFRNPDFGKKVDEAGERGEYNKFMQGVYDDLSKDLLKAMNRFDNDVKAALRKYGFK